MGMSLQGNPLHNSEIAELLLEVSEALELLEENPFKSRAFRNAAQAVARLDDAAAGLVEAGGIHNVKGIGPSIAKLITDWVLRGDMSFVEDLRARLPKGYAELRKVPGLGLRRIRQLFFDLGIGDVDELARAVDSGRLSGIKGFSEKTLERLRRSVADVISYRGLHLLDEAWAWMEAVQEALRRAGLSARPTGKARRGMEVIDAVDLLCVDRGGAEGLTAAALEREFGASAVREGECLVIRAQDRPLVAIHLCNEESLIPALFVTTGAQAHVEQARERLAGASVTITHEGVFKEGRLERLGAEDEIYGMLGLGWLPPEVREGRDFEWSLASRPSGLSLLEPQDFLGVFHVHTSMSDGKATLGDMAIAARDRGYSWVGMSDHSRSAYYAGGLSVEDLKAQARSIDALNEGSMGIRVFKGVESDILPDGSLDYPDEVLKELDFIIASVHSHMDMDRQAMTRRIIRAMERPFVTMLGHPTGRLLLARRPYEVDMEAVLEAALKLGVIIELNAHPMRLDLDWRLVRDFTARGGVIAVNPDAHDPEGFDVMRYGIAMARKGALERASCINCMDEGAVREALARRWS
jgi:DNA polymerase (family 10)